MNVWTVANQKGGVGKTTTAVTLAGLLAQRGQPTLLVDMDPHGSMTSYFGFDPDDIGDSVYTLFDLAGRGITEVPESVLIETNFDNLALLPASTALATLDRQLGAREGMGLVLARALEKLAGRFAVTLIDCPPVLGVLMVNALAACQRLVVPVQTEFLALKGLERMKRTLAMIMRARRLTLPCTIVPTMFDQRAWACLESLQVLRKRYGAEVWEGQVPVDTQFRDASRAGMPLPMVNPEAIGVTAYRGLLDYLLPPRGGAVHSMARATS